MYFQYILFLILDNNRIQLFHLNYNQYQILNCINLQLLIEARILKHNGFRNAKAGNIDLIEYMSIKNGNGTIINNEKDFELNQLIIKTEKFMKYLTEYFNNEENGYIPTGKDNDKNDYLHLSRFEEWVYN